MFKTRLVVFGVASSFGVATGGLALGLHLRDDPLNHLSLLLGLELLQDLEKTKPGISRALAFLRGGGQKSTVVAFAHLTQLPGFDSRRFQDLFVLMLMRFIDGTT